MRTPIINKPLLKKFATVNKSTKIKHIAAIHQNRITSTLCRPTCTLERHDVIHVTSSTLKMATNMADV